MERVRKIDKRIINVQALHESTRKRCTNQRANLARLAHTIARNKIQARWKNYTPPTQARKIWGAYHMENLESSITENQHTKYTHGKSTVVDHTRGAENCGEYMDGIIILDTRKNIEYISPSE